MKRFIFTVALLSTGSCTKDSEPEELLVEESDLSEEIEQEEQEAAFPNIDDLMATDLPQEEEVSPSEKVSNLWVAAQSAEVYSEPSRKGEPVITLPQGIKVPVLEKENGWVRISSSKYIRMDQLTSEGSDSEISEKTKFVVTPDLNIRSAPNKSSPIVGRLTKGEKVVVEKKSRDTWVKIGEGQFVNGKYLVDSPKQVNWAH